MSHSRTDQTTVPSTPSHIAKRAIFYIGGYDPKAPDAFFARLDRETARFAGLWGVETGPVSKTEVKAHTAHRRYAASGKGWTCETDFHFVALDSVVLKDFTQPAYKRIGRYLVTVTDYFTSGTAFSFFRHAWRFGLYFLYPITMLLVAILVSLAAGWLLVRLMGTDWLSVDAGMAMAVALVWAAIHFVFPRIFVLHLMDLWSFSRDFVRRLRSDIETKLDHVAGHAAQAAASGAYDEIIFIGHSTGGGLALSLAARTQRALGNTNATPALSVMTVGSTALKIGLHPKAGWFRDEVGALVADPAWSWAEFQALPDIINFYKTDPATLMGAGGHGKPVVNAVRMKAMVDPNTYKRMKGNFFRMHYQFVFGNSKRYWYDFPAICFGPAPVMARAKNRDAYADSLFPEQT